MKAVRLILRNGITIMDYFNNGNRGIAFSGLFNSNYEFKGYFTQEEFDKSVTEWIEKNRGNEDVERIEIL